METLERRTHCAVHAVFLAGLGQLSIFGDNRANTISVGRSAEGGILINGGAVPIVGGTPTVANTRQVRVLGFAGDDVVTLDEAAGALPPATLFGGAGDDVLTGGSGRDLLFGQDGNDFVFGMGGADLLFGGGGADSLAGGAGDDQSFGDAGNDNLVWSPGDGSDRNEGGAGTDTVSVNGATVSEAFSAAPHGARVRLDRTDPAPFSLDIGTSETLSLRANGGDDTFTAAPGVAPLIHLTIDGGLGDDTLLGSEGPDDLLGRDGKDFVDGNGGNDLVLLGDGDDVFQWDPGDGSDVVEGQNGTDAMIFNGSSLAERIDVAPNGSRVRLTRDLGNIVMDVNGLERVDVNAFGGDDTVVASSLAAGILALTEDGGAGNDTLVGSRGDDTLVGGDGNDEILGFRGSDTAFMGAGDDTFEWLPGDASDAIEGQGGRDKLDFIGSNDGENFDVSANGNRVRLLRSLPGAADVVMDLGGVEQVDLSARGGADTIVVNDQSATDLTALNIDLDSAEGDGFGDNAADSVIVNGTNGDDGIQIASFGLRIAVGGLFPFMNITGEDGLDALAVNTLGGNDVVDAANLAATNASQLVRLTLTGGAGSDTLAGSQGADTFVWNPGDGSDTLEGGDNPDTMVFNGNDLAETVTISADGGRVRFTREPGNVVMDLNDVERLDFNALGGADAVNVNDLSGTDVNEIRLSLAGTRGGGAGDGVIDSVTVNGSNRPELIPVLGVAGGLAVDGGFANGSGLPYFIVVRAVEAADRLRINGNGGDDTVDATGLQTPVTFAADGGAGNDTLRGSPFNDLLLGGDGDDTLIGGPGVDTLDGGPGNNVITQ